jgi:hypothetical protein
MRSDGPAVASLGLMRSGWLLYFGAVPRGLSVSDRGSITLARTVAYPTNPVGIGPHDSLDVTLRS